MKDDNDREYDAVELHEFSNLARALAIANGTDFPPGACKVATHRFFAWLNSQLIPDSSQYALAMDAVMLLLAIYQGGTIVGTKRPLTIIELLQVAGAAEDVSVRVVENSETKQGKIILVCDGAEYSSHPYDTAELAHGDAKELVKSLERVRGDGFFEKQEFRPKGTAVH